MSTRVSHDELVVELRGPRSGVAVVRAVPSTGRASIAFAGAAPIEARIAVPGYDEPREGDQVLGLVDDAGEAWVVGVVRVAPPALIDQALEASRPTVVRDRRGRVLFEYDPSADRAVLHIPSGDLEVSVPEGALRMRARDGIELAADGDVSVRTARAIELEAARAGASARVSMQPGELTLVGAVVTAAADRAEILASRVGITARSLESHVDRVRSVAEVVELRAGRIIERAKDVYREASGLSQTRAGRLKLVAQKAAQLVGENTLVKARDRMKVKGERIHLA